MAERGLGLRRRLSSVALLTLLVTLVQSFSAATAQATPPSWTDGEAGSGPAPFPVHVSRSERALIPTSSWVDLGPDDQWAKNAIDHVAGTNDWMSDFPADENGNWRFRPDAFETRKRWARAIVRAFAPDDQPDPSITFTDLDPSDPFHRWAVIAVQHGWMTRGSSGLFHPSDVVTGRGVHRSLVRALGMGPTAAALDHLSTADDYEFGRASCRERVLDHV